MNMKLTVLQRNYIVDLLDHEIDFLCLEELENEESIFEVVHTKENFLNGDINKKQLEIILSYVYLEYSSIDENQDVLEFLEQLIEALENFKEELA